MGGIAHSRTLVKRLSLRDFRNLKEISFEPASRFNLIHGDNGHGKTSLIEALYLICTTQSFRSKRLAETIREGSEQCFLRASVESFSLQQELRASLSLRGRSFLIDGKKPKRKVDYALRTPIIAFHPGDLLLVNGPASSRRNLLDRVILHEDPTGADCRILYKKALRERQKILSHKGTKSTELDVYEELAAGYGARFALSRELAAKTVLDALCPAFDQMVDYSLGCEANYLAGGVTSKEDFLRELRERRQKDLLRGAATFGPQRDDLALFIEGRPARSHASQGQQRLLTLAMKLAELSCVKEVTNTEPMLLLDDVSSELDPRRTAAVFELLRGSKSQIFVTTTRPELFSELLVKEEERADFELVAGVLTKAQK